MKNAKDYAGNLEGFLHAYKYQTRLTAKLDRYGTSPFDQQRVNEIVLWKVNRYAELSQEALKSLNGLSKLRPKEHRQGEAVLSTLLGIHGVDLPMASTLLRFRNPKVFQIVDRHSYRAINGKNYPLHRRPEKKIELYFNYLDDLITLAESKHVEFRMMDRVLYQFDKQENGALSSKLF